jgi:integrase
MASVFARGPKSAPRWYARVKINGTWRARRVRQLTKATALAVARAIEAREERRALGLEAPEHAATSVRELLARWEGGLTNRGARNDSYRIRRHLVAQFGGLNVSELTLPRVMLWLDDLAAAGKMRPSSQRGLLALLSRFCSWCVDRGFLAANPCKAIPNGRRPRAQQSAADVPWLADDAVVMRILERLPAPFDLIFLLANRCGLRTGEACGLRLGDLADMTEGSLRIARSYLGPTKESKGGAKTKHVPAPSDLPELLGPWLDRRRAAGATDGDLVFPARDGRFPYGKDEVGYQWRKVRDALELPKELTFHRAGRHSFASRGLAAGASIDEISQALGHSSVALTQARYLHFQRRVFSAALTAPLQPDGGGVGKVIPITGARPSVAAESAPSDAGTKRRRVAQ